jgi:nucleoredoxin
MGRSRDRCELRPAAYIYPVIEVGAGGVVVNAMGSSLTFPPADTDLLARAETEKRQAQALAAARAKTNPHVNRSPAPAASSPTPPAPINKMADRLNGKLVVWNGNELAQFEASALKSKKYLAVYFSASWCGPCKKFTPRLVNWYRERKAELDKFDVVFVSRDDSKEAMLEDMKQDGMPWPALKFSTADQRNSPLEKYAGRGIPCLVIIDTDGKVISHSYKGEGYRGPSKVMKDLEGLLAAE